MIRDTRDFHTQNVMVCFWPYQPLTSSDNQALKPLFRALSHSLFNEEQHSIPVIYFITGIRYVQFILYKYKLHVLKQSSRIQISINQPDLARLKIKAISRSSNRSNTSVRVTHRPTHPLIHKFYLAIFYTFLVQVWGQPTVTVLDVCFYRNTITRITCVKIFNNMHANS